MKNLINPDYLETAIYLKEYEARFNISFETEKAIMIQVENGKWGGETTNEVWLPKSQITIEGNHKSKMFKDSKPNEYTFYYDVFIPEWLAKKNNLL